MARKIYVVSPDSTFWKVSLDGRVIRAGFTTQKAASDFAVHAAHADGRNGNDAQVLIQGADGRFRTEWTYGHDPYPPRG